MSFNPYEILGVPQQASADDITAAYRRELTTAARLGALKTAQEVDRAYTLLRDPGRRSLYDRHRVSHELTREHPLQRYAPPRAVPFRTWSPAADDHAAGRPPSWPPPASTARTVVVLALVSLLVSAGGWLAQGLRSRDSTTSWVRSDCPATASTAAYSFTTPAGTPVRCTDGSTPTTTGLPQH